MKKRRGGPALKPAMRGTSVSRLVGEMLREHMESVATYEGARRSYIRREATVLKIAGGKYPTRDEIHSR